MSMQQIMRWGMIFLRIRRGEYLTFGANGEKPNVNERTHQTVYDLSCLIHPIIYYCQKLVEVVIAWGWEEYGQGNLNLGENVFDFWGKLKSKMHGH